MQAFTGLYDYFVVKGEMAEKKTPECFNKHERFSDYELRALKAEVLTLRSEMATMQAEVGKVYRDVRETKEVLERLSTNTMLMISAVLKISQSAMTQNTTSSMKIQQGVEGSLAEAMVVSSIQTPAKVKAKVIAVAQPSSHNVTTVSETAPRETPQPVIVETLSNLWQQHSVKTVPNPVQVARLSTKENETIADKEAATQLIAAKKGNVSVLASLASKLLSKKASLSIAEAAKTLPPAVPMNEEEETVDEAASAFRFTPDQIETALNWCRRKKNSRRNYATHLLRLALPESTRRVSNCSGVRGQLPIDAKVLGAIKREVLQAFPVSLPLEVHSAWRECIVAMDESCRRLRRLHNTANQPTTSTAANQPTTSTTAVAAMVTATPPGEGGGGDLPSSTAQ